MEHRYGQRWATSTVAGVYRAGKVVGTAQITNFSRSGVYLQPRIPILRRFQVIELELPCISGVESLRVRAGVTRVDADGIGVQFDASQQLEARVVGELRAQAESTTED